MRLPLGWSISALLAWICLGCASVPSIGTPQATQPQTLALPRLQGSYHIVQRGETLWRIAHSYGLDPNALASANRLPSTTSVSAGQRLFIPLPTERAGFLWPLRGSLRPAIGSHGIEIDGPSGSLVRAARGGRVAVAAREVSGWGKTIVLDHLDGYLSIYAGLDQLLVAPGAQLRQGMPVGSLGSAPLHFEIRYGAKPKNALALLPSG